MNERFAARDGDIVAVAPLLQELDFFLDLLQRFVTLHAVDAVTAPAVSITTVGHFKPANRIVVAGPRETVHGAFFERHRVGLSARRGKPWQMRKAAGEAGIVSKRGRSARRRRALPSGLPRGIAALLLIIGRLFSVAK